MFFYDAAQLFKEIKKRNIPFSGHCSDVYLEVNKETKKLIEQYKHKQSVTTFKSNIDGKLCYDIPFLNMDYKKKDKQ